MLARNTGSRHVALSFLTDNASAPRDNPGPHLPTEVVMTRRLLVATLILVALVRRRRLHALVRDLLEPALVAALVPRPAVGEVVVVEEAEDHLIHVADAAIAEVAAVEEGEGDARAVVARRSCNQARLVAGLAV